MYFLAEPWGRSVPLKEKEEGREWAYRGRECNREIGEQRDPSPPPHPTPPPSFKERHSRGSFDVPGNASTNSHTNISMRRATILSKVHSSLGERFRNPTVLSLPFLAFPRRDVKEISPQGSPPSCLNIST